MDLSDIFGEEAFKNSGIVHGTENAKKSGPQSFFETVIEVAAPLLEGIADVGEEATRGVVKGAAKLPFELGGLARDGIDVLGDGLAYAVDSITGIIPAVANVVTPDDNIEWIGTQLSKSEGMLDKWDAADDKTQEIIVGKIDEFFDQVNNFDILDDSALKEILNFTGEFVPSFVGGNAVLKSVAVLLKGKRLKDVSLILKQILKDTKAYNKFKNTLKSSKAAVTVATKGDKSAKVITKLSTKVDNIAKLTKESKAKLANSTKLMNILKKNKTITLKDPKGPYTIENVIIKNAKERGYIMSVLNNIKNIMSGTVVGTSDKIQKVITGTTKIAANNPIKTTIVSSLMFLGGANIDGIEKTKQNLIESANNEMDKLAAEKRIKSLTTLNKSELEDFYTGEGETNEEKRNVILNYAGANIPLDFSILDNVVYYDYKQNIIWTKVDGKGILLKENIESLDFANQEEANINEYIDMVSK